MMHSRISYKLSRLWINTMRNLCTDKPYSILFNFDTTVLTTKPSIRIALDVLLDERSLPKLNDHEAAFIADTSDFPTLVEMALKSKGKLLTTKTHVQECVDKFIDIYTTKCGIDVNVDESTAEVLEVLEQSGFRPAMITNYPQVVADILVKQYPFLSKYTVVGHSKRCPIYLPNGGMLLYATEMGGGDTTRAMYVGSSYEDGKAANAAGFPFILIKNRTNTNNSIHHLHPSITLDSLQELPDALEQLLEKSMY